MSVAQGMVLVPRGTRLAPRHIGVLAADSCGTFEVIRRPRVGVFTTGAELADCSDGRKRSGIFDAGRPTFLALAEEAGAEIRDLGIAPDTPSETTGFFLTHAGSFDLLISSGAASICRRGFVRPAFKTAGGTVRNGKVALKPGKPALFGHLGSTTCMGLPGNPLAVYACFELFVRPQIETFLGKPAAPMREVPALSGFEAK